MKKTWICWWTCLCLTIICLLINRVWFHVPEIIQIEFARSAEQMNTHILHTAPSSPEQSFEILKMNTAVDYAFLIFYTLLTYFSFQLLLRSFDARPSAWVTLVSAATGLLDAMENLFLMNAGIRHREEFSWLYAGIVRAKWAFAIIPLMLVPVIFVYGLVILFRDRRNDKLQ